MVAENPRGKQNSEDQNRTRRAENSLFRGSRNEQRNKCAGQNPEDVQRPRQRGRGAGAGGQEKRKIPVCPEKTEKEEEFERNHCHKHSFGEEHRGECDFGRREHQQERGGQRKTFVPGEFQRRLIQNRNCKCGDSTVHQDAEQQTVSAHRKRECEKCRIERHAERGRNAGGVRIGEAVLKRARGGEIGCGIDPHQQFRLHHSAQSVKGEQQERREKEQKMNGVFFHSQRVSA